MKKTIKTTVKGLLLAGVAALAVNSVQAQSEVLFSGSYVVGDLIAGFTTTTGNDLLLNLGLESNLANGQYWDLTTLVGSGNIPGGGSLATVNWGVIAASGGFGYGTGNPGNLANNGTLNNAKTGLNGFGGDINPSGLGYATPAATASGDLSWNQGTIVGGTSTFKSFWYNPNSLGAGTVNFYKVQNNNTSPVQLVPGTWTLSASTGDTILSYGTVSVPEPATYGMIGGAGLLLLGLRRMFLRTA